MRRLLALLFGVLQLLAGAAGHGAVEVPASRNYLNRNNDGDYHGGSCRGGGPEIAFKSSPFPAKPQIGSACGDAKGTNVYGWDGLWGDKGGASNVKTGSAISVKISLSANHLGAFLFYICPGRQESLDCFLKNPLLIDSGQPFYSVKTGIKDFQFKVRMPPNLKGSAVMQWVYWTENSCCLPKEFGGRPDCKMEPCGKTWNPEFFMNCILLNLGDSGDGTTPGQTPTDSVPEGQQNANAQGEADSAAAQEASGGDAAAGATPSSTGGSASAGSSSSSGTASKLSKGELIGLSIGDGVAVVALGVAAGFAGGVWVGGAVGALLALLSVLLWWLLYINKLPKEAFDRERHHLEGDDWAAALPSPPTHAAAPHQKPAGESQTTSLRRRVARLAIEVARVRQNPVGVLMEAALR